MERGKRQTAHAGLCGALGALGVTLALSSLFATPCLLGHYVRMVMPGVLLFFAVRVAYGRAPAVTERVLSGVIELSGLVFSAIGMVRLIRGQALQGGVIASVFVSTARMADSWPWPLSCRQGICCRRAGGKTRPRPING